MADLEREVEEEERRALAAQPTHAHTVVVRAYIAAQRHVEALRLPSTTTTVPRSSRGRRPPDNIGFRTVVLPGCPCYALYPIRTSGTAKTLLTVGPPQCSHGLAPRHVILCHVIPLL